MLRLQTSSVSPCQSTRMKKLPVGSLGSIYSLERLLKTKVKYYNKFTMHFWSPRGYIQTAVKLLILMIRDTMAPLWLHHCLKISFFTLHLSDTHLIFYLSSLAGFIYTSPDFYIFNSLWRRSRTRERLCSWKWFVCTITRLDPFLARSRQTRQQAERFFIIIWQRNGKRVSFSLKGK